MKERQELDFENAASMVSTPSHSRFKSAQTFQPSPGMKTPYNEKFKMFTEARATEFSFN